MKGKLYWDETAEARAKKRAYARKYYQANKTRAQSYYALNRDKIRFRSELWRVANRERYLRQQATYDRTKRGRGKEVKPSPEPDTWANFGPPDRKGYITPL